MLSKLSHLLSKDWFHLKAGFLIFEHLLRFQMLQNFRFHTSSVKHRLLRKNNVSLSARITTGYPSSQFVFDVYLHGFELARYIIRLCMGICSTLEYSVEIKYQKTILLYLLV